MESLSAGLLPKWLLLVSIVSIANSVQAYLTIAYVARVYPGSLAQPSSQSARSNTSRTSTAETLLSPVTPLSSRTFGTWTLLSGLIRAYAGLNIHDASLYQLALLSYVVVVAHFGSEWLVYGTTRWGKGLAGPVLVGTSSLVWMVAQWRFYIRQ